MATQQRLVAVLCSTAAGPQARLLDGVCRQPPVLPIPSRHIERLWAAQEVDALRASKRVSEAIRLASKQQLVTPVTGAVVLETIEQYKEMGLTPVMVDTVPGIPEPSTIVLMLLGILVCLGRLKIIRLRSSKGPV